MTDVATKLKGLTPWLATVARGLPYDTDDLIQEGRIAAWQASLKTNGKNSESFMKAAALWRMKALAFEGRAQFGSRQSWGGKNVSDPMSDEVYVWTTLASFDHPDDLVYHYDEIHGSLQELTQAEKEYVYLRFWRGMNTTELDKHFGYTCSGLWTRSKRKLKEELNHLEGAV